MRVQFQAMHLFFPDPQSPTSNVLCGWSRIPGQFGLGSFYFFFRNIIKVKYFFIVLLHLISSFLHTRSLLILYAYDSTKSIGCIVHHHYNLKQSC